MATRAKTQTTSRHNNLKGLHMSATHHDLPEETRQQMVQICNEQLADTFDLFSQTKQAHWNVKGPDFYQLHELYDELAEQLLGHVDLIAERATALGGAATGTVRMAAGSTRLEDYPEGPVGSMESVRLLVERYANVAHTTREAIDAAQEAGDQDTADLFTEVSRDLDKDLWFLEAHIQADE
jgi:starvation-inducible DNA-binding protein